MSLGVMVDLETLDTAPTAVVLSIGAVEFDENGPLPGREFYRVLDLTLQKMRNRTVSQSTLDWWDRQSPAARTVLDTTERTASETALQEFTAWYGNAGALWGNGANFDNVILRSLYDTFGLPAPWRYWEDRCHRTLISVVHRAAKMRPPRAQVAHHALEDARQQAERAAAAFRWLAMGAA